MRCGPDPKIEGVLSAVPYLKKFGVTPENLIYKFDFKGTRFIYLWSWQVRLPFARRCGTLIGQNMPSR
jgi:hypothetical protein